MNDYLKVAAALLGVDPDQVDDDSWDDIEERFQDKYGFATGEVEDLLEDLVKLIMPQRNAQVTAAGCPSQRRLHERPTGNVLSRAGSQRGGHDAYLSEFSGALEQVLMVSRFNGRPRPPRMHLRLDKRRRRTLCGRDLVLANSVHIDDVALRRVVTCRQCLARVST